MIREYESHSKGFSFFCQMMPVIRKLLFLAMLWFPMWGSAQSWLEGFVRSGDDGEPVPGVYVVNVGSLENTLTNSNGYFRLRVDAGDSLVLSHMAFNFTYYQVGDTISERFVEVIVLDPKNYLLDEVSVHAYKLSTNQPKPMRLEEPHVPAADNIRYPTQNQPSWNAPADILYWYFGNRPRQLRELRRLQREDAYREQLRTGNNRAILMEITGLTAQELEAMAFSCKYGNTNISTANDYDLLVSILTCYREYRETLERERLLNEAESGWE